MQVAVDKGLRYPSLRIQRSDNEQLQSELLEQLECVAGILIVDFGKHFVHNDKLKSPRSVAGRINIKLISQSPRRES